MVQYLPDDRGIFTAGNYLGRITAGPAGLNVNIEQPFQSLGPDHRHMRLRGCFLILIRRHFPAAPAPAPPGWGHPHPVIAVRCKDTMESSQVDFGPGY